MKSHSSYINQEFLEVIRDFTSFGNPFILFLLSYLFLGAEKYLILILLGLIIIEILCNLIKLIYHKERPKKVIYTNFLEKITAGSFPSIHVARSSFVFLTLFLLSTTFLQKTLFSVLLVVIGLSRVILKKHFWFDVIVGYIIGFLMFSLIIFFIMF